MRKKQPIPFSLKFPNADPSALKLLQRLLAFDPKDRPTAEEVGLSSWNIDFMCCAAVICVTSQNSNQNNSVYA